MQAIPNALKMAPVKAGTTSKGKEKGGHKEESRCGEEGRERGEQVGGGREGGEQVGEEGREESRWGEEGREGEGEVSG